jgi:uncharacterized protein with PQ loop repeat
VTLLLALQVVIVVSGLITTVPQVLRARHDVEGLALPTWTGFIAVSTAWMAYGVAVGDPLQLVVNVPIIILDLVIIKAAWPSATPRVRRGSVGFAIGVLIVSVSAALGLGSTAAGLVAICVTMAQMAPQVVAVVRTANPTGVSVATWLLLAGNQAVWVAYGALDGQPLLATNATIMGSLGLLIAMLTRHRTQRAAAVPTA